MGVFWAGKWHDSGESLLLLVENRFSRGKVRCFGISNKGVAAAAAAKSRQSCLTLCYTINGSPTGSSVPRILQARTLEWVAISFSNSWKWKVKVKSLSRVRLLVTPWTVAHQVPPSMGFSKQEYWSGVPLPSGMGKFNSDDHYICYCGQESLRRNGVAIMVNKRVRSTVLGCNLENDRMICLFPRQTI